MALTKSQALIDRCLRISLFDKVTGMLGVLMPEVEDFQISVSIDNEKTATSASVATVATFEEGKSAEITGNASFFNYGLMAAQSGTAAEEATSEKKIKTPRCDVVTLAGGKGKLTQTPVGTHGNEIGNIYEVLPDGGAGKMYSQGASASENAFTYAGGEITAPTGVADGTSFFVFYEYESATTVHMVEDADVFAKTYRMHAEVLTADQCNPAEKTVMSVIANSAKLSSARDVSFTTDGKHPFTLKCQSDYCGAAGQKRLFEIFAPEE